MPKILIETAISDALDRLSILDVKQKKIENKEKQVHILYEKGILENKLKEYTNKVSYYYKILILINEKIWDLLDQAKYSNEFGIHNELFKEKQLDLFKEQEDYNERRFRVKRKIDNILNSDIKEQKGYHKAQALVLGHLGMGDMLDVTGLIRYLSTKYDKVVVIAKSNYSLKNIKQMFSDDNTIEILQVKDDRAISPAYGASPQVFNTMFKNYDQYLLGFHQHGLRHVFKSDDLPFSFYDDVQIPHNVYWDYFHVNVPRKSKELYNMLNEKNISNYIFVHNSCSFGEIFDYKYIEEKLNTNKNEVLFINPCKNMYDENHKYFELAEKMKDHLLLDYVDLIENADSVIVTDSGFFSLCIHLKINTDKCYFFSRENDTYNYEYEHIWSDKNKSNDKTYKKFIQINKN
jgi:hypothetical protein